MPSIARASARFVTPLAVALTVPSAHAPRHAAPPPDRTALARVVDSLVHAAVADGGPAGVSVALIRRGDTITAVAGLADVARHRPVTARTPFAIASITKQYTAALVVQLSERKRVGLDEPISAYLRDLPLAWRAITVRQLLAHRSGIPDYAGDGDVAPVALPALPTPRDIVTAVRTLPMRFPAGTQYMYSNTNYVLLGLLIETVTGRRWADQVHRALLAPLGLRDTWHCDAVPRTLLAEGYSRTGTALTSAGVLRVAAPWAAGALCATALDVARYEGLLARGRVVSRASVQMMTALTPLPDGSTPPYGLGTALDLVAGHATTGHSGGIDGFVSDAIRMDDADVTVVVFANTDRAPVQQLSRVLARAALGLPLPVTLPKAEDRPMSPDERARFTGRYAAIGGPMEFRVVDEGGALMLYIGGGPPSRLLWQGGDAFRAEADALVQVNFSATHGSVDQIHLRREDDRMDGRRVPER